MPESRGADGLRQRPKRIITPARKEQNRVAQRAYRQRQKKLLEENQLTRRCSTPKTLRPSVIASHESTDIAPSVDQLETDILKVDLDKGPPLDLAPLLPSFDHLFPIAQDLAEQHTDTTTLDSSKGTDSSTTPDTDAEADDIILSSPYLNSLELNHTALMRACLHNARSIGISVQDFFSYQCMSLCSPFYRPNTSMKDDPRALVISVSHPSIPPHLQPTLPQILFPHHPLLDLLPLPELRSRAIMLAATAPNFLDPVELKMDIVTQGGIICRGGHPWDKRSWIIAPWFMKKWRLLMGNS